LYYLQANVKASVSPLAASPHLWQAIRYGIDYKKILRLGGTGSFQACGMVARQFNGALPKSACPTRNVTRAKSELQRAMADVGVTKPSLTMEFPTDFSLGGLAFGTVAEAVQQDMAQIGLTIDLKASPLASWLPRWSAGLTQLNSTGLTAVFNHESSMSAYLPT